MITLLEYYLNSVYTNCCTLRKAAVIKNNMHQPQFELTDLKKKPSRFEHLKIFCLRSFDHKNRIVFI